MKPLLTASALILALLVSCAAPQTQPTAIPAPLVGLNSTLTQDEVATLGSLQLVDDHPLYTMRYVGTYSGRASLDETSHPARALERPSPGSCPQTWGCSLFATLADEKDRLYGRNFDWQFSPALLLFTDPADGYASVSMVDIAYLGFDGDRSRNIIELPLDERAPLLNAPLLPFDGMNEKGLAIGMAAVPEEEMPYDPLKETIGELRAIREMLDHAATVDEAVRILGSYNIDMGDVPVHYLIASASGNSALVEFRDGKMEVFRNVSSWRHATNFLISSTQGDPAGQCWRYDRISQRLKEAEGRLSSQAALSLLEEVSQAETQWSLVYHMTSGDVDVVMGRDFSGGIHTFHLN